MPQNEDVTKVFVRFALLMARCRIYTLFFYFFIIFLNYCMLHKKKQKKTVS